MGKYKLITTWVKKVSGPIAIIASLVASGIAMNFAASVTHYNNYNSISSQFSY